METMARSWMPVAVGLCMLASAQARAQTPPGGNLRIFYEDTAGCSTSDEVQQSVTKALGAAVFNSSASNILVVTVGRASDPGKFEARYALHGPKDQALGSRQNLVAASCEELMTVLVFSLNLTVQNHIRGSSQTPTVTAPSPASSDPASPPVVTALSPVAAAPSTPRSHVLSAPGDIQELSPPAAQQRAWQLRAGTSFLLALGAAPESTWGVAIEIGVGWRTPRLPWPRTSLSLEGRVLPRASFPVFAHGLRGGLELQTFSAALIPCLRVDPFDVCGVLSVGTLDIVGGGFDGSAQVGQRSGPVAAFGVRSGLEVPFHRLFSMRVGGEALASLLRPVACIGVGGEGTGRCSKTTAFWTLPPVTGTLLLGLAGHFF